MSDRVPAAANVRIEVRSAFRPCRVLAALSLAAAASGFGCAGWRSGSSVTVNGSDPEVASRPSDGSGGEGSAAPMSPRADAGRPRADTDAAVGADATWAIASAAADGETPGGRPEPAPTGTDLPLTLFGEVGGRAASTAPKAALESIAQISFAADGADFDPDLDSAGRRLVFASTQHSPSPDIYRMAVGGTTITQLTTDPGQDMMPAFAPDDRQIAFASDRYGQWDIFIMSADGGQAVRITDDPAPDLHPSWSPDGRSLVFCRLGAQSGRWELWVVDLDQPSQQRFIGYGLFPEWCPDPLVSKIAYQQARDRGSRLYGIWTIDYVEGEGRRPTEIAASRNAAAINPSWSADGRWLAFSTIVDPAVADAANPAEADVWITTIDGRVRLNLTEGEHRNVQPVWGADARVYFVSDRGGLDQVWAVEPQRSIRLALGPDAGADEAVLAADGTETTSEPSDEVEAGSEMAGVSTPAAATEP